MVREIELIIRRAMSGAESDALYALRHGFGISIETIVGEDTETIMQVLGKNEHNVGQRIKSAVKNALREEIMAVITTIKETGKFRMK